jgi:hypothetical protein
MVAGLLRHLTSEMLLPLHRNFFSYKLWKKLTSRDVKLLARVTSGLILKPILNLPDGSYLAKIYRSSYDREKNRDGIVVRVIRYTLDDPQRVGHNEEHVLPVVGPFRGAGVDVRGSPNRRSRPGSPFVSRVLRNIQVPIAGV